MKDDSNINSIIKNKYQIIEFKGKGGFAKVYLAKEIQTKKLCAVKILMDDEDSDFENEIKMLKIVSQLKNPYIVNIIDWGEDLIKIEHEPEENHQFIVMDYASKGELFSYISCIQKGLENKTAKLIFYKILKGLEAIHNSGICHRDLKIDNILMDEFFNPKICDFGLATELKGKNGDGKLYEIVGTERYIAPEILNKIPYNGVKADIFSLGVVLLNITFAKCGFIKPSENDKYYKYIYKKKYDKYWKKLKCFETVLDKDLKELYLKMVSYKQEDRPTIKEIFESPWMKEIIDLDEKEYKKLEEKVYDEFKGIYIKILEKNGTVNVKDVDDNEEDGQNRGSSEETTEYFDLDLIPKQAIKTGFNMKHYMKIIGKVKPSTLMNIIANKIKSKYQNKIDIIPNNYKLRFDICYENMEDDEEEDNEEEEENDDDQVEEEENKNIRKRIKNEKSVIRVKLFESPKGGYIVSFIKKKGETIEFHKNLEELRNIIKELDN